MRKPDWNSNSTGVQGSVYREEKPTNPSCGMYVEHLETMDYYTADNGTRLLQIIQVRPRSSLATEIGPRRGRSAKVHIKGDNVLVCV